MIENMLHEKIYDVRDCCRHVAESSNGEAIEGISQAQWEAFTIEEQFSQCQLSQCSKCLPNSEAIYTRNVIRMAEQNNEIIITGKLPDVVLDVERILDKELIRIFMLYEARKTPWGLLIDSQHLDFCMQLIGRSLKSPDTNEYQRKNNDQTNNIDVDWENIWTGSGLIQSQNDCTDLERVLEGDDKIGEKESKKINHREESWPLLRSIMQLDGSHVSPHLIPLGHGENCRVRSKYQ